MSSQTAGGISSDWLLDEYLNVLSSERWLSQNTTQAYRRDLRDYLDFLAENFQSMATPQAIDQYVQFLYEEGLKPTTVSRKIAAIRGFHRFQVNEGHSETDPSRYARTPRVDAVFPKALPVNEVIELIEGPQIDTPLGRRDRALLETLYATGARVSEAVDLDEQRMDVETATALLIGKGGKQRIVPLGSQAVKSIESYLPDRSTLLQSRIDSGALFLSRTGRRLTRVTVNRLVEKYARQAGIPPHKVSPHVLRHSAATHMVEGGADLRVVQEILGHANLSTTQVYTKMSLQHLQEVYVVSHPRALRSGLRKGN